MQKLKLLFLSFVVLSQPVALAATRIAAKPTMQIKTTTPMRVFVAAADGSVFKRVDASTILFVKGSLLVSVKPPMQFATVKTPFGTVTVPSDSVVYVSLADGQLQVQHLHGTQGANLSATLRTGLFKDATNKPLTIAVGQHMAGSMPVRKAAADTKEAIPPLPTPLPTVVPMSQANLQVTGNSINSMAKNLPNLASRRRFAATTKTPLVDDWVDDFDFGSDSVENATGSDTNTSITSPNDIPSTDIQPADSFQTARENVQRGEFQPEAATQGDDDSGLEGMWGRAEEGPDFDATGGMLDPVGAY